MLGLASEALNLQCINAALIGPDYSEFETFHFYSLAKSWQSSEFVHDQAADRVIFVVVQLALKIFIKIFDTRQRAHGKARVTVLFAIGPNEFGFLVIMLVINFSDNFFEHILDRQQTGNATVLVYNNRHVIVTISKFL